MSKHVGFLGHEKIEYETKEVSGSHALIDGEWIFVSNKVE